MIGDQYVFVDDGFGRQVGWVEGIVVLEVFVVVDGIFGAFVDDIEFVFKG